MASKAEIDTIEVILDEKEYAKKHKLNYIKHLSGGKRVYKNAISTVVSVGALQIVSSIIGLVWDVAQFILLLSNGSGNITENVYYVFAVAVVIYLFTIGLSYKMYTLEATPAFVLGSLLFILIINIALAVLGVSFISILTATFAILGLARWSAYKCWFEDIDPKRTKRK